jgi:hypothetical protein
VKFDEDMLFSSSKVSHSKIEGSEEVVVLEVDLEVTKELD